jgi:hypothetical protein
VIVILLAFTGNDSYTFPMFGITITGDKLWLILGSLHIFFLIKGLLTGALNNVIPPWSKFNHGDPDSQRVYKDAIYWEFFFNNVPLLVLPVISLIIIAFKLSGLYLS